MELELQWTEEDLPEVTQIFRILGDFVPLCESQKQTGAVIVAALQEYYFPSYSPKVRVCHVNQKEDKGLRLVLVGVHTNPFSFGDDYVFYIGPRGALAGPGGRKRQTQALTLRAILNGSL